MPSPASLTALLVLALAGAAGGQQAAVPSAPVAAPAIPPETSAPTLPGDAPAVAPGSPTGSSADAASRYDEVGYASWYGDELGPDARTASGDHFDPAAITVAHRTLPLGSFVEITALATGRTIVALVNDRGPHRSDRLIDLSRGAAQLLGVDGTALPAVRVRDVVLTPPDRVALQSGHAAAPRLDAPPALVAALRARLPGASPVALAAAEVAEPLGAAAVAPASSHPQPSPKVKPRVAADHPVLASPPSKVSVAAPAASSGRYVVQVAAFSSRPRAEALAHSLHGSAAAAGALWRVRLGPFGDAAAAHAARDAAARRGYGDAQVLTTD